LGLFVESPRSVYALGARELVLHFDGKSWIEEHAASEPTRKAPRDEDLLFSAFHLDEKGSTSIAAFGPHAVLIRQPNAMWKAPSEAELYRLAQLGMVGPADLARPPRCDLNSWFWLARRSAWFTCQDGRTFTYEAGEVRPKGKQPERCQTLTAVASAQGEINIICANGTLWSTTGQVWNSLPPPKDKDKDYRSISAAGQCLFLANRRTVWRSCGH
jgi:hypothetical protein